MIVTSTARFQNGKLVYDRPETEAERVAKKIRFAEMCQVRQAPGTTNSERAFMEGQVQNHGFQKDDKLMAEAYCEAARMNGIDITGKVYRSGLADPGMGPADPTAWVGSRDEMIAVGKAKNRTLRDGTTGEVIHKARETPPVPDVPLNARLTAEFSARYLAQEPGKWEGKPEELKEFVQEKHGAPAAKNRRAKPWKPHPGWKNLGDS